MTCYTCTWLDSFTGSHLLKFARKSFAHSANSSFAQRNLDGPNLNIAHNTIVLSWVHIPPNVALENDSLGSGFLVVSLESVS